MIANFFSKTKPTHAIFVAVLFLTYFLLSIIMVEQPQYSFIVIAQKFGLLFLYLAFFFLVNFINRKNHLTLNNSYVILLLCFLFGMFPKTMQLSNELVAHFFLLLAFRRIYSIRTYKSVQQKLLDSGLWIGVATLIFNWSAVFLVVIFAAIIAHKNRKFKNFVIPLIGFAIPLFLGFTYSFVFDDVQQFYNKFIFVYSLDFPPFTELNVLIPITVLLVYVLIAIVVVTTKAVSFANDLKQSWLIVLVHFLCAVYCIVIAPFNEGSIVVFAFFPLVVILGNNLQLIRNKFLAEAYVLILLAVSFLVYFL